MFRVYESYYYDFVCVQFTECYINKSDMMLLLNHSYCFNYLHNFSNIHNYVYMLAC